MRRRTVAAVSTFCSSWSVGTFGGGGGGGVPSNCSSTHLPRFTGEVRVGFDVTVKMLACVINPPRRRSLRLTR